MPRHIYISLHIYTSFLLFHTNRQVLWIHLRKTMPASSPYDCGGVSECWSPLCLSLDPWIWRLRGLPSWTNPPIDWSIYRYIHWTHISGLSTLGDRWMWDIASWYMQYGDCYNYPNLSINRKRKNCIYTCISRYEGSPNESSPSTFAEGPVTLV